MYSKGQTIHQANVAAIPDVRKGPTAGRENRSGKCRLPESTNIKYVVMRPIVLTHVTPKPYKQSACLHVMYSFQVQQNLFFFKKRFTKSVVQGRVSYKAGCLVQIKHAENIEVMFMVDKWQNLPCKEL